MEMLNVTKIEDGISINGVERKFTFNYEFENGFEVISPIEVLIELDGNLVCLKSTEIIIDGVGPFEDVSGILESLYGISDQWLQFKI
jgi:hypothetical protein